MIRTVYNVEYLVATEKCVERGDRNSVALSDFMRKLKMRPYEKNYILQKNTCDAVLETDAGTQLV